MGLTDFLSDFAHGAGDALNAVSGGQIRRAVFGGEDPFAPDNAAAELKGIGQGLYEGGKLSVQMSQVPRKVLQEAVLHPTDIAEHLGSAVRTGQEAFNSRRQIADVGIEVGKAVVKDQLDPKNIAINAAILLASGGTSAAFTAGRAGLEGVEAYRAGATAAEAYQTARTAMTTAKVTRTVGAGARAAKTAEELSAATESGGLISGTTRAGQGEVGMWERLGNKRASLMGDLREGVGMNRLSYTQRGRQALGNQFAERFGTDSFVTETAARMITGAPGAPTTGGLAAESMYRGRTAVTTFKDIKKAQAYAPLMHAIDDPAGALTKFGVKQAQAHKTEIAEFGVRHADDVAHFVGKAFKGDEEKEGPQPAPVAPPPTTEQAIGLTQFSLANTRSTRASRRQPGGRTQLGTITGNETPAQIGPSDWYGPQGGYDAGRGFQQRTAQPSGALPPLEQPREMVGI